VVEPVPGDDDGFNWRTRVEFAVGPDGRPGLRRHRSHEIVEIGDCLIADRRVIGTGVLRQSYAGTRAVDVVAPSVGEPVVVRVPGGARTSTPVRGRKSAPVPVVRERVTVGAADAGQDLELELE